MLSYSKALRGLSVQSRVASIFTRTTTSPDLQLRQCPSHYAIRAGQNLPDKEFRYLRTVIVTAAVHRGFSSARERIPLTFRHRAGVSPYTSTFVFAETCVFGKQFHGIFSCGPVTISTTMRQTSRFFSSRLQNEIYFVGLPFSLSGKSKSCERVSFQSNLS